MGEITVSSPDPAGALEIVSTRVFAHSASVVFAAYTDDRRLAKWWGPTGFTNTFHEFDLRPGGRWRFTMQGPDGARHENECQFLEISAPRRIVFRHLSQPEFRMTVTLADEPAGTRVTWRMEFATAEDFAQAGRYAVAANEETLDRLAILLAATTRGRKRRT
jgi:uncharacterized protein YndB with AHSA1/START domain